MHCHKITKLPLLSGWPPMDYRQTILFRRQTFFTEKENPILLRDGVVIEN